MNSSKRDGKGRSAFVTRREIAGLFEAHPRTVSKWERLGMPIAERGRNGKPSLYRERDVRLWLERYRTTLKAERSECDAALARRYRAQARLAEQMFATRAKQLLPTEDVHRIWTEERAAVRRFLLAWPAAVAERVSRAAGLQDVAGVEHALKDEIHVLLHRLSDPSRSPNPDDGEQLTAVA